MTSRSRILALYAVLTVASGIDYEVRTTVHSSLLDYAALERLASQLASGGVTEQPPHPPP